MKPIQKKMTVEQQAEEIVSLFDLSLPIDPLSIAREEGIKSVEAEGNYDARIEHHVGNKRGQDIYLLLFAPTTMKRPLSRQRFSIAHELGHFYIPRHRKELQGGKLWTHKSSPTAVHNSLEREANAFAAALLLPTKLVTPLFHSYGLDLEGICGLADTCQTSLRATARRYTEITDEACGVILSKGGKFEWSHFSLEAKDRGYGWRLHPTVPKASSVHTAMMDSTYKIHKRQTRTAAWLVDNRSSLDAYEESLRLNGDWVLTMLFWDFPE